MSYSPIYKKSRPQDMHLISQLKDPINFISARDESARMLSEVSPVLEEINGTISKLRKSFKNQEKVLETLCQKYKLGSEKQPSFDGSELKLANDVDIKDLPEPNVQSVEMSYDVPSSVKKSSGVSHDCSKECWVYGTEYKSWQLYSPLDIPLKLGWKRITSSLLSPDVYYVAPCGKEMRSIEDINIFLRSTGVSCVSISQFTFDLNCQLETKVFDQALCVDDISVGKERRPISCVNTVNEDRPEEFEYTASRTSQSDLNLCTDPELRVCCSCTDGCRNRSKCECWQLTLQEAKMIHSKQSVGYVNHQLRRHQHSAIYECNPSCHCDLQYCANRVVQHGIQFRLQVFCSPVKQLAWGLRTLDDIPQGSFVCTYIGHIYTEKESDKQAQLHGDEYFAELDYIEIMQHQLNINNCTTPSPCSTLSSTNTPPPLLSLTSSACSVIDNCSLTSSPLSSLIVISSEPDSSDDSDMNSSHSKSPRSPSCYITSVTSPPLDSISLAVTDTLPNSTTLSMLTNKDTSQNLIDSSSVLSSKSSIAVLQHPDVSQARLQSHTLDSRSSSSPPEEAMCSTPSPLPSPLPLQCRMDRLVRKNNGCYIMDAKKKGNLGRFINHSCSPNLFVQNVFIDSQDSRFPWVALFASRRIKALEELTWDYSYDVGSVPGRNIDCLCGSAVCRGRLL
ncbi:histone-lysine N-methyltransferase SETDB1-like isoform X2 [Halichondria panicea]|uniref:histone-lysine N-methyltransferase SETDB1-like isoform X2 n=1 Tax=Halichondria panicea TaxID=6063 RepID=UPI00312B4124